MQQIELDNLYKRIMYRNQQQGYNPYQRASNENQPNMYNPNPVNYNNNPGGYGYPNNYMNQGSNPQTNLYGVQNAPGNYQYNQNKLSEQEGYSDSLEVNARKGFITKVYMLLSLQLLLTTLIGYISYNNQGFRSTFMNTPMVIIISVGLLAVTIVMACCTDFFRRHALPIFIIFTLLMALLVSIAITGFSSKVVLMAVVITLGLTIGLTIYAWKTDSDVTGCGPYLMVIGLVLLVFGIIAIFWRNPIVQLIYSGFSSLLFGFYIIFHTQLVLGNKQHGYSLDDAYFAAIQLYTDIINLFLNLLQIIARFQN